MKKYPSRWFPVLIVATLFTLVLVLLPAIIAPDKYSMWSLWPLIFFAVLIAISKLLYYIEIREPNDFHAEHLLNFHHGNSKNWSAVKVSELEAILYHATSIGREKKRTIYFVANKSFVRRVSETRYAKKTLGELIRNLKKLNPSIELDDYTISLSKQG